MYGVISFFLSNVLQNSKKIWFWRSYLWWVIYFYQWSKIPTFGHSCSSQSFSICMQILLKFSHKENHVKNNLTDIYISSLGTKSSGWMVLVFQWLRLAAPYELTIPMKYPTVIFLFFFCSVFFLWFYITALLVMFFMFLEQVGWDGTIDSTISVISQWDLRSPNSSVSFYIQKLYIYEFGVYICDFW